MGKRAYSIANVIDAKFKTMPFDGIWLEAIGEPELTGSWFIFGPPKNGKTSFAMMLANYLARFGRVAYDSVEEGLSLTIKKSMKRARLIEVGSRVILLEKEGVKELQERLDRKKSPEVVIIDSVQFMELSFTQYKELKNKYPNKLFVYISHIEGKAPDGSTAKRIWRDANVVFRIEGFKAFATGRYEGKGTPIVIHKEGAMKYWGDVY